MTTLTNKIRTTVYLTQENKKRLDRLPRAQKTAFINKAIANTFAEREREEAVQNFLNTMATIQPVKTVYSSEKMVRMLRAGKLPN